MSRAARPLAPPTIHEAAINPSPPGTVFKGAVVTEVEAIARRQLGLDVVVCGHDLHANRAVARSIEAAVGPCRREEPHARAGPDALPHFQPIVRPPAGHCFYETQRRKARRMP